MVHTGILLSKIEALLSAYILPFSSFAEIKAENQRCFPTKNKTIEFISYRFSYWPPCKKLCEANLLAHLSIYSEYQSNYNSNSVHRLKSIAFFLSSIHSKHETRPNAFITNMTITISSESERCTIRKPFQSTGLSKILTQPNKWFRLWSIFINVLRSSNLCWFWCKHFGNYDVSQLQSINTTHTHTRRHSHEWMIFVVQFCVSPSLLLILLLCWVCVRDTFIFSHRLLRRREMFDYKIIFGFWAVQLCCTLKGWGRDKLSGESFIVLSNNKTV